MYELISADSHVIEPGDLFQRGLPTGLRDRAPTLASWKGGSAWMVGDDISPAPLPKSAATGSGYRLPQLEASRATIAFEEVLPALYDPGERVKAQDADSVDAEVLYGYPYLWDAIKQLEDPELRFACARAFNDWIAEFCAHDPRRLIGVGRIPTSSIGDAHEEIRRCVEDLHLTGMVLDAWPDGSTGPTDTNLDPIWDVASQTGTPISLHYGLGDARSAPTAAIAPGMKPPMSSAAVPLAAAGVFDRFPNLRLVFAHADAGWSFHWLEFLDNTYQRQRHLERFKLPNPDAYPSEYIRRHFWFTIQQDRTAVTERHMFGDQHLMWASHYPLDATNWPDNRAQAIHITEELPREDRQAILAENVARLYRLPGYEDGVTLTPIESIQRLVHI
jgi:predicted TIM-barrel fold metal-dependent hydrolase